MAQKGLSGPDVGHSARSSLSHPSSLKQRTYDDVRTQDKDSKLPEHSPSQGARQRFVFTDPVAFRYLEEDASTTVLERHGRLEGYEIYLVEQWACSRLHPTFVITTYTGDSSHGVSVSVLSVPTDEDAWSSRLKLYFVAVSKYHARRKDTPLGVLMVTNLSGFPSALTVIAVPEGDIKKHREDFIVNENLKRMGCSGRSGLTLSTPTGATEAKFQQLYRISSQVPLYHAVIEMVKLCQVALTIFPQLKPEYADGLLCDVTEQAINDWWAQIGTEFYELEPSDGILGPTTVSALLGLLMGTRNRLSAYGIPIGKDAFDLASLKKAIGYFQKSQKLKKTRRLDLKTLQRLQNSTAKAASGEGWIVPKAVKSTMAEFGSRGGEMVMGMVGAREKAGISDVETLDIEAFARLAQGERAKWLWRGKRPKHSISHQADHLHGDDDSNNGQSDNGGYNQLSRRKNFGDATDTKKGRPNKEQFAETPLKPLAQPSASWGYEADGDSRMGGRIRKHDSRSGFTRIKEAVGMTGLRGYHRHPRDDDSSSERELSGSLMPVKSKTDPVTASVQNPEPSNFAVSPLSSTIDFRRDQSQLPEETKESDQIEPHSAPKAEAQRVSHLRGDSQDKSDTPSGGLPPQEKDRIDRRLPESGDNELKKQRLLSLSAMSNVPPPSLRRHSFSDVTESSRLFQSEGTWPRHLSFSVADEAILSMKTTGSYELGMSPVEVVHSRLKSRLKSVKEDLRPWLSALLREVENMDDQALEDRELSNDIYTQRLDEHRALRDDIYSLLGAEKSHLHDLVREIEVLGAKLDYELSALVTKVKDVDEGVNEFERQVAEVERRVGDLDAQQITDETWTHWTLRVLTGIGKGPERPGVQG